MTDKPKEKKRRIYKDKDGLRMEGVSLASVVNETITVLAKREYQFGEYAGLAIKVEQIGTPVCIIESTSRILNNQLVTAKCPKPPFKGHIEKRLSKKNREYYTFVFAEVEEGE